MSEQFSADVQGQEPGGYAVSSEFSFNDIDLAFLKDFLTTVQGCNVARFSGYGISVDFRIEDSTVSFGPKPLQVAPVPSDGDGPLRVDRGDMRDAWRNPNLWPQQNGRVLKFDGSLE